MGVTTKTKTPLFLIWVNIKKDTFVGVKKLNLGLSDYGIITYTVVIGA